MALAEIVDWSMIGGNVFTDNTFSTYASGISARFGTFGIGYDFTGKSFSQLDTDFSVVWGTTTATVNGQFYEQSITTGIIGTPWYIFLGSSASSFGIFTNPNWVNEGDDIFPHYADLSDPGTYAAGGFGYVSGDNVALIPEPSTIALLAIGSATFLIMRKRRKLS